MYLIKEGEALKFLDRLLKRGGDNAIKKAEGAIDDVFQVLDDETILKCYDSLNIGAAKADFWRYLILYKTGGIYIDVDSMIGRTLIDGKIVAEYKVENCDNCKRIEMLDRAGYLKAVGGEPVLWLCIQCRK